MGLEEAILTVKESSLTAEEKRISIYRIKAEALGTIANQILNKAFTVGNLSIRITEAIVLPDQRLYIKVTATREGRPIIFPPEAMPFLFVNPPVSVVDSDGKVIEDPEAALHAMIASTVDLF